MGVIKGKRDWLAYGMVEDMEHILEPVSSSDNESVTNVPISTPRRRAQRSKMHSRDISISDHINSRRKGQKQARRCDNLKELINMVEKEDIELDFNIFEPTISAFAELLSEHEKMKAWNDFVNSTEEEQMELLERDTHHTGNHSNDEESSDLENNDSDLDSSWELIKDKRSAHPSFSAEECFMKIDKNIRTMLKRRHKPMGLLFSLEEEIVNFFKQWPQSVYISKLSSSYERMILHALCQYLDLMSKSYDCDGLRQTQVENPHHHFVAPEVLLTQYLEKSQLS